jgi:hypothetical protein
LVHLGGDIISKGQGERRCAQVKIVD